MDPYLHIGLAKIKILKLILKSSLLFYQREKVKKINHFKIQSYSSIEKKHR